MNMSKIAGLDFLIDSPVCSEEKLCSQIDSNHFDENLVKPKYKILIVDDDYSIHRVSKLVLRSFEFEGSQLTLIHAYSYAETLEKLKENNDIAVVILDIVMDTKDSGLKIIKTIREELNNSIIRIIVRTGQPGDAPEHTLVRDYDINDYRLKTELTAERMATSLYSALRSYRDLLKLTKHKQGLNRIIKSNNRFMELNSIDQLLTVMLHEMTCCSTVKKDNYQLEGVVMIKDNSDYLIITGSNKYKSIVGKGVEAIDESRTMSDAIYFLKKFELKFLAYEKGFLMMGSNEQFETILYIQANSDYFDHQLVELMGSNCISALNNYLHNQMSLEAQKEILYSLGETAEAHFKETGGHIRRVSIMMYHFAKVLKMPISECEMIKIASTMHDIGKIAIPDRILKKPGKLTDIEFDIMKTHTSEGEKILGKSNLPILKLASQIALYHHERIDGNGYPNQLKGEDIPFCAKMMSIVDVYDALINERVYKKAISKENAFKILVEGQNQQFDEGLLTVFIENIDVITL